MAAGGAFHLLGLAGPGCWAVVSHVSKGWFSGRLLPAKKQLKKKKWVTRPGPGPLLPLKRFKRALGRGGGRPFRPG